MQEWNIDEHDRTFDESYQKVLTGDFSYITELLTDDTCKYIVTDIIKILIDNNNYVIINQLLDCGLDPNIMLEYAILKNDTYLIKQMLDNGANPNECDTRTIRYIISIDIFNIIIEHSTVNLSPVFLNICLVFTILNLNINLTKLLIEHGAKCKNTEISDSYFDEISSEMIFLLLDYDIFNINSDTNTLILMTKYMYENKIEYVEQLFELGLDVSKISAKTLCELIYEENTPNILEVLLKYGYQPNREDIEIVFKHQHALENMFATYGIDITSKKIDK